MQPTYLIVGYFGYDLVGDDAVLISTMDDLKKKFDNSIFIITSADCSKNYGANVRAIPINDLGKIVEAIEEADLVLVGGGGIFNEDNPYHASTLCRSAYGRTPAFHLLFCSCQVLRYPDVDKVAIISAAIQPPFFRETGKHIAFQR